MKDNLRKVYIAKRKNIPYEEKKRLSSLIQNNFIESDTYIKADKIFIYVSMENEVGTGKIIERALCDGKTVAVPISKENRRMYFVPYEGIENMVKTRFGVLEPVSDEENEILPDENSVFIVPGVAFDEEGRRMGYGGGYYDTYIDKYHVENTVALAFDIQLQKTIPFEEHDKKMKYIITEKRIAGGADL